MYPSLFKTTAKIFWWWASTHITLLVCSMAIQACHKTSWMHKSTPWCWLLSWCQASFNQGLEYTMYAAKASPRLDKAHHGNHGSNVALSESDFAGVLNTPKKVLDSPRKYRKYVWYLCQPWTHLACLTSTIESTLPMYTRVIDNLTQEVMTWDVCV